MIDIFCNPNLLTVIQETRSGMKVSCNTGSRVTSKVGELQGYGYVQYDPSVGGNSRKEKKECMHLYELNVRSWKHTRVQRHRVFLTLFR